MTRLLRIGLSVAWLALGSACGGGGSGGSAGSNTPPAMQPPPPTPAPPPAPPPPSGAQLSGTIVILESSAIDGDVNDPLSPLTPNDTFASAQSIGSPTTVGGFANVPDSGAMEGRSRTSGDEFDFYVVDLGPGESVVLSIADFDQADLDLRLYDESQNLVDASLGFGARGKTESVAPPAPGTYFVEVFAFDGASNYVLSVGRNNLTAFSSRRLSVPIVPRQALAELGPGLQLADARVVARMGRIALLADATPTPLLPDPKLPAGARIDPVLRARYETHLMLKRLAREPGAGLIEPNFVRRAQLIPSDEFFDLQWHYGAINAPQAWDLSTGDPNVVVAVVDTGVLLDHPDLAGKLLPGYDFVPASLSLDGDGPDPDPNDPGDGTLGGSSSFHGTHVAGTVGAASNNGIGVAGVGFDTRIMPVRVLGSTTTSAALIDAIHFAAGLANSAGVLPARAADVINLSLGGAGFSQCEQNAILDAVDAGVMVVAAAGNDASSAPFYPASYDGVISVSATTISNTLAPYSNFGPDIDVAAPGGSRQTDLDGNGFPDQVLSTSGSDRTGSVQFDFSLKNGTSMAAPHVAGVLALMKAADPALTPVEVDAELAAGRLTSDLGPPGRDDQFGNGLIDASAAVARAFELAASGGIAVNPALVASPAALNFGAFATLATFRTRNAGGGNLSVAPPVSDQPWLTVTEDDGDGDNLGSFTATIDRSQLSAATERANISFTSSANALTIPVSVRVPSPDFNSDAGLHFIIVVDIDSEQTVAQVVSSAAGGTYTFDFEGIEAGSYQIVAGTDSDDDGFLCDAGEACGVFRNLDSPDTLVLDGSERLTNLDFGSGFLVNLIDLQTAGPEDARQPFRRLDRP